MPGLFDDFGNNAASSPAADAGVGPGSIDRNSPRDSNSHLTVFDFDMASIDGRVYHSDDQEMRLAHRLNSRLETDPDFNLVKVQWTAWSRFNHQVTIVATSHDDDQAGQVDPDWTPGALTLDRAGTVLATGEERYEPWHTFDMHLVLHWTYRNEPGNSTSGVFTLVNPGLIFEWRDRMREKRSEPSWSPVEESPASLQSIFSTDAGIGTVDADVTRRPVSSITSANVPSATESGGSARIATPEDGEANSSGGGGGGGGGGGLSTGAVAGIGVAGGVVALAIIAALIWFLCFRNRRKRDRSDGAAYTPEDHHHHDYISKESHGQVIESPHSPYSDDAGSIAQQFQTQPNQNQTHRDSVHEAAPLAAAGAMTGHTRDVPSAQRHSVARYSDASAAAATASSPAPESTRAGARSATPQGVNPNVSHLIEDGMTEDEIRRLEEEERQLDAAIEQAGQGRRRKSQIPGT